MQAIDYSKYENMSQAALKEQIKEAKLKLKQMQKELNLQSKLVEFLTQKLGLNIGKSYALDDAPCIKMLDAEFAKLSPKEQEELINEVKNEMHGVA